MKKKERETMQTMKKKTIAVIGVVSLLFGITGCGNKIPEMDEQQEKLVVEYMAGTLLKYDVNYVSKLTQLPAEPEVQEEEVAPSEEEVYVEAPLEDVLPEEPDDLETQETKEESVEVSMEEILGLDGVSIQYTGYKVTGFYPEQGDEFHFATGGENFYFLMEASNGNKLLVLGFEMKNTSMEDVVIDLAQRDMKYKIRVNGDESNALNTMLLNDLRYYQGTVAAGAVEELVLVREIPAEWENGIENLELTVKSAEEAISLSLN